MTDLTTEALRNCPFDGPRDRQPEPEQACSVCGDLGTWDDENLSTPSRCIAGGQIAHIATLEAEILRLREQNEALAAALRSAKAALADIGDAEREPGDDLEWCEQRAAEALPAVRAALAAYREDR